MAIRGFSGASLDTLFRRVRLGGRKGRAAIKRLRRGIVYQHRSTFGAVTIKAIRVRGVTHHD